MSRHGATRAGFSEAALRRSSRAAARRRAASELPEPWRAGSRAGGTLRRQEAASGSAALEGECVLPREGRARRREARKNAQCPPRSRRVAGRGRARPNSSPAPLRFHAQPRRCCSAPGSRPHACGGERSPAAARCAPSSASFGACARLLPQTLSACRLRHQAQWPRCPGRRGLRGVRTVTMALCCAQSG